MSPVSLALLISLAFGPTLSLGGSCVAGDTACILNADNLNGSEALAMLHLHSSPRNNPGIDLLPPFVQDLLKQQGVKVCWNRGGTLFTCAKGYHCCGDVCVIDGGACCQNANGNDFSCGKDSTCCGNACAAPGSKCCKNAQGYKYPVTSETKCADELSVPCTNTRGDSFLCGEGSSCCGDICVAPGGTCCQNALKNNFACAKDNFCCGDTCASAESKCCKLSSGVKYPVTDLTECASSLLEMNSGHMTLKSIERQLPADIQQLIKSKGIKVCANGAGNLFSCGAGFKCCGDVCTVEDGPCCTNSVGYKFGCGSGSSCCGNACAAPGSKCCERVTDGYKYPVTQATQCSDELSVKCINTHGDSFLCGKDSICCGDICVAPGGTCCTNTMGNNFACAKDNSCCGNGCSSAESKCCTNAQGYKYSVTKQTACAP